MATSVVNHTYKLKRGKEDAINKANPLLLAGEPIVVYCNDGKTRLKIGNGTSYYQQLEFISTIDDRTLEITNLDGGEI